MSMRPCPGEPSQKLVRLQQKRDNIFYVLTHEELSDADTLQLQAHLSVVQDEIVLLHVGKAA